MRGYNSSCSIFRRTWQMVKKLTEQNITADSLVEGNSYVFRVSAVNKYGSSEPTELSSPVTVKSQIGESSIYVLRVFCERIQYSSVIIIFNRCTISTTATYHIGYTGYRLQYCLESSR